jgi:hypothetical protein
MVFRTSRLLSRSRLAPFFFIYHYLPIWSSSFSYLFPLVMGPLRDQVFFLFFSFLSIYHAHPLTHRLRILNLDFISILLSL